MVRSDLGTTRGNWRIDTAGRDKCLRNTRRIQKLGLSKLSGANFPRGYTLYDSVIALRRISAVSADACHLAAFNDEIRLVTYIV